MTTLPSANTALVAASVSVASRPPFTCIYGPSGFGKTTTIAAAYLDAEWAVVQMRSLKSAASVLGRVPQVVTETPTLDAILVALRGAISRKAKAFAVDDLNLAIDNQKAIMPSSIKGWDIWNTLYSKAIEIVLVAENAKLALAVSAHSAPPKDGRLGGPAIFNRLRDALPKLFDKVLLVQSDPIRRPMPVCFRAGLWAGPEWVTKDRDHVVIGSAPPNLSEILRASGYAVPRPRGTEWMDSWVDAIAPHLTGGFTDNQVLSAAHHNLVQKRVPDYEIAWVLRDARDRAEIARAKKTALAFTFGF